MQSTRTPGMLLRVGAVCLALLLSASGKELDSTSYSHLLVQDPDIETHDEYNPLEEDDNASEACGPNEEYYVKIPCPPNSCDSAYTTYKCDGQSREGGCDCKKNYSRHPHGTCVLSEDCPPAPVCGPNEEHYPRKPCPPKNCNIWYNNYTCSGPEVYGCDCIEDYLRDPNGLCIPAEDCPVLGEKIYGINEVFYDVKPCPPLNCSIPSKTTNTACDGVPPTAGRDCREDYKRHPNGTCIYYEYCPRQCGVNETYVPCNNKCPNQYCPRDDKEVFVCNTPRTCSTQCACKPNYLWEAPEFETCILASECPPVNCTKPNEEWNSCASPCRKESCDSVCDEPVTQTDKACTSVCEPRCVCQNGYWRNMNHTCVPAKKCPLKNKGCPTVKPMQVDLPQDIDDDIVYGDDTDDNKMYPSFFKINVTP